MRSGAFRRGLTLLAFVMVMAGCSSATKRQYLRHLSVTIAPEDRSSESAAVDRRPAVAAADAPDAPKN